MNKRIPLLVIAFAATAAATIVALVMLKHGSLREIVAHPPPAHARYDDPTLAAVRGGDAKGQARDAPPARSATTARHSRAESPRAAAQTRGGPRAARSHHHAAPPLPTGAKGDILVVCRPGCRIFVDGRPAGHSPPLKAVAFPVGTHHLRVVDPLGHVVKRAILVAPNRVNRIRVIFGDERSGGVSFRQETGTEGW